MGKNNGVIMKMTEELYEKMSAEIPDFGERYKEEISSILTSYVTLQHSARGNELTTQEIGDLYAAFGMALQIGYHTRQLEEEEKK